MEQSQPTGPAPEPEQKQASNLVSLSKAKPGQLSLDTLCDGELYRQALLEIQAALRNIDDPQYPLRGKREVVLKISLVPLTEDRGFAAMEVSAYSKLQKRLPSGGTLKIASLEGELFAIEQSSVRQGSLLEEK